MYLYPARRRAVQETQAMEQVETSKKAKPLWGKLLKNLLPLWKNAEAQEALPTPGVTRTEYFFRDYRLIRVAVTEPEHVDDKRTAQEPTELLLREQLQELTEDPDHTYVVCREPLSFYFGREFREYRQQNWVEHLLQYGERGDGWLRYPNLVILGRNPFLTYEVLRYAAKLRRVSWYLTKRQYREEEDWLVEELEEEYGLIPELHLLATDTDYTKVRLQDPEPCVVMDFCDNEKICGTGLAKGSIWLDFTASEEKERRLAGQCPRGFCFSLKKEWKDPRKALEYLDTISKNGYNNSVD